MSSNSVELSHLRCFVAVAEELHFGRAAERLHMAQPPLTRQIRMLEERLGCRLLERNTRSTRLNAAGTALLERARAILSTTRNSFAEVNRVAAGMEGTLRLSTAPSLMLGDLPWLIRTFRRGFPKIEIRLNETASAAIVDEVRTGATDLGLIRGITNERGIDVHLRRSEPMVAILPRDHTLAAAKSIDAARLRKDRFVFFPKFVGPSFHDEVMAHFLRAGFSPQIETEARQWPSIISLVSAGFGVSVGPASVGKLMPGTARFVPLRGFSTSVELLGRTGDLSPAAKNFLAIARTFRER